MSLYAYLVLALVIRPSRLSMTDLHLEAKESQCQQRLGFRNHAIMQSSGVQKAGILHKVLPQSQRSWQPQHAPLTLPGECRQSESWGESVQRMQATSLWMSFARHRPKYRRFLPSTFDDPEAQQLMSM